MIGFYTKFTTEETNRDALGDILREAASSLQSLPECKLYIVNKDIHDARFLWVTEMWDSSEAHAASLTLPSAQELIAKAMPLMSGQPEQILLTPLWGKGL